MQFMIMLKDTQAQRRLNKKWVQKRDEMAWDMWKDYCNRERKGDYTES